ncbi:leukocyte surface antigen CD53-like [Uranotaenia lowii]|uniref:leukocyte surface antigen CD53-like n=1 Tax=Uranotaenia lowii TaxID=190385 RepID=UPI00247AB068|nr:leukocyte surface antigen CD53-like [Uranotaenia lowii]
MVTESEPPQAGQASSGQRSEISRKRLNVTKYVVLTLTGLGVVFEIFQIILGASAGRMFKEYRIFIDHYYISLMDFIVVIGVLMLLISLFCCVGIILENVTIISTYVVLYTMMVILEIIGIVSSFNATTRMDAMLESRMFSTFALYLEDITAQGYVNHLQQTLECCGIHAPTDWHQWPGYVIPPSCHPGLVEGNAAFPEGCYGSLRRMLENIMNAVSTGTMIVIVFQLLCMLGTIWLLTTLRRFKRQQAATPRSTVNNETSISLSWDTVGDEKPRF